MKKLKPLMVGTLLFIGLSFMVLNLPKIGLAIGNSVDSTIGKELNKEEQSKQLNEIESSPIYEMFIKGLMDVISAIVLFTIFWLAMDEDETKEENDVKEKLIE